MNPYNATSGKDFETRRDRVEQVKRKITSTTLPLLRLRERQVRAISIESAQVDQLANRVKDGSVNKVVLSLAQDSLFGSIDNLLQPIRPLEEKAPAVLPTTDANGEKDLDNGDKKDKETHHVHPTRLAALNLIMDDALSTSDEVCAQLGNMRNGKPHGKWQANMALRKAVGLLTVRQRMGDMNPEEQETMEKIQHYVRTHRLFNPKDMAALVSRKLEVNK